MRTNLSAVAPTTGESGGRKSLSQQVFPTVLLSMITVGLIRNGANYLSHHLRKNDYWAEGEKEVHGEWIG